MAASMAFLAKSFPGHGVDGAVVFPNTVPQWFSQTFQTQMEANKVEIRYNTSED